MKNKTLFRLIIGCLAACQLTSCGIHKTTAEYANHGVGLTASLELELADFRRRAAITEREQKLSITQQTAELEAIQKLSTADLNARKSAGDTDAGKIMDKLIDDAEDLHTVDAKLIDEKLGKLLLPLPETTTATMAVQDKLAAMGTKIPTQNRKDELEKLSNAIHKNIKANKLNIKSIELITSASQGN